MGFKFGYYIDHPLFQDPCLSIDHPDLSNLNSYLEVSKSLGCHLSTLGEKSSLDLAYVELPHQTTHMHYLL